MVVCAAGFPLTTDLGLLEPQKQIVIGVCFFVAGVGSITVYLGQKSYLLLTGATLNAQFKIVRNQKEDTGKIRAGTAALYGTNTSGQTYPKTIAECESQISALQGHLMVLLEKAVNLGSRSESASSSAGKVRGENVYGRGQSCVGGESRYEDNQSSAEMMTGIGTPVGHRSPDMSRQTSDELDTGVFSEGSSRRKG